MNQPNAPQIRPPRADESDALAALVNRFAAQQVMLPRDLADIRATLPNWLVAVEDIEDGPEQIVGCGSLVALTETLVEVRSLAVEASQHGKGVGSALVLSLVQMAREREYSQVCALTLREAFFQRLGFRLVNRWSISPKVWQACIYCPKVHRCDEVAVMLDLTGQAVAAVDSEAVVKQAARNPLLKHGAWQPLRLAFQEKPPRKVEPVE